ncbi:MAG: hypothetical protein ABL953_06000 [Ilumatobacteraceae bacterium]
MALNATGPPASTKQVAYLASLLEKAGYASFREARHPMGLNQRQAGGKFTVQEASALIDQLLNTDVSPHADVPAAGGAMADIGIDAANEKVRATQATMLRGVPAELLSDELLRRGWSVRAPS